MARGSLLKKRFIVDAAPEPIAAAVSNCDKYNAIVVLLPYLTKKRSMANASRAKKSTRSARSSKKNIRAATYISTR